MMVTPIGIWGYIEFCKHENKWTRHGREIIN